MQNIDEYIKNITIQEEIKYDDIDNIILDHCYIHYKFNYKLVTESNIYESSTSKFPEQDELVKNILTKLNKYKGSKQIKINNKFIKDIYIHFKYSDENKMYGEYVYGNNKYDDYNEIRWNDINQKFNFIEINIYNYEKDPNGLEEILYHETKYIWDDYQLMLHHNINLSKIIKQHKSKNELIENILYYGNKYEISAYLSQLNKVLENKKYHNIKETLDDIIKSSIYQNYKYLYYIMIEDKYKNELLKEINNKEYNKIKENIRKCWDKIIHHIYIICGEHIDENRIPPTTRNNFINKN